MANFRQGHLEQMFIEMRKEMETILAEMKLRFPDLPDCPSQSHRAVIALRNVKQKITACRDVGAPPSYSAEWRRVEHKLEDFLSVHRTVCLLEWHERNGSIEGA